MSRATGPYIFRSSLPPPGIRLVEVLTNLLLPTADMRVLVDVKVFMQDNRLVVLLFRPGIFDSIVVDD